MKGTETMGRLIGIGWGVWLSGIVAAVGGCSGGATDSGGVCRGSTVLPESGVWVKGYPSSVATADIDGDGRSDLVVGMSAGYGVSVYLNRGNGSFTEPVTYVVGSIGGSHPTSIAAADLDDDGAPDLAVVNLAGGNVSLLFAPCLP